MPKRITITPSEWTWTVRADGAILGETRRALELREGNRPPVIYIPREDVAMALFEPSPRRTPGPLGGRARRLSFVGRDGAIPDAAWSYEAPPEEIAGIAGHLAFDPERITVQRT